jgi:hypothetical protein
MQSDQQPTNYGAANQNEEQFERNEGKPNFDKMEGEDRAGFIRKVFGILFA